MFRPFSILAPLLHLWHPKNKELPQLENKLQFMIPFDSQYVRTSSSHGVRLSTFTINSAMMILPVLENQWDTLGGPITLLSGITFISMIISKTVNQSHARNTKTFKNLGKSHFCPLPLCWLCKLLHCEHLVSHLNKYSPSLLCCHL